MKIGERIQKQGETFNAYQKRLILRAIDTRIREEAEKLAAGMDVTAEQVMDAYNKEKRKE